MEDTNSAATTLRSSTSHVERWGGIEPLPDLQRVGRLVILAGIAASAAYAYFLLDPDNRGTPWVWGFVLVAEGLTIVQALAVWWTVLAHTGYHEPADAVAERERLRSGLGVPTIDVFVTVAGEPLEIVERTVRAARDMELPHETWVLDDGWSDELQQLCQELGVGYLRRADRSQAKAGNVNAALRRTSGALVALFDADHVPARDFLLETAPHFLDRRVAFVQSPQWYANRDRLVPLGASESQRIFYELICPGKSRFNAVFCVGTNVVFRREALAEVGGLFADSKSEDIWTSLLLHRRGWRSVFVPKVLARGLAPDTLGAYLRQQFRWARGGFEIVLGGGLFRRSPLTLDQRLQYAFTGTHYLLAFATLIFQLLPASFLLAGAAPVDASFEGWMSFYVPYAALLLTATFLQAGGFKPAAIVASLGAAPVHLRAFLSVILGRSARWNVTNVRGAVESIELVLPQFALFVVNVLAIAVGVVTLTPENRGGVLLALGWASLHALILGRIVLEAFVDASRLRRESKERSRRVRRFRWRAVD